MGDGAQLLSLKGSVRSCKSLECPCVPATGVRDPPLCFHSSPPHSTLHCDQVAKWLEAGAWLEVAG